MFYETISIKENGERYARTYKLTFTFLTPFLVDLSAEGPLIGIVNNITTTSKDYFLLNSLLIIIPSYITSIIAYTFPFEDSVAQQEERP